MAVYTYELDTSFSFPNIDIYKHLADGVQVRWRATAQSGYVFYDPSDNTEEYNEQTGEHEVISYYYRNAYLPLNFNFANFPYIAVLESTVDENYIFGGSDNNDHEVM